ncbi:MAG: hypothetical protein H7Z41_15715, partial [Cytophagales bacterium]|nr:hypothetical protein [Armatimonadota bacterium]
MGDPDAAGAWKVALRRRARETRAALDTRAISAQLRARIAALPEYQAARHVLLYLALPGEVRVEALMTLPGSASKQFYVPRCAPDRRLALHPFLSGTTPLVPGPFGIREPDAARVPEATPANL